jgi:hypothetical protein
MVAAPWRLRDPVVVRLGEPTEVLLERRRRGAPAAAGRIRGHGGCSRVVWYEVMGAGGGLRGFAGGRGSALCGWPLLTDI